MTIHELLESGLIKDNDMITISIPIFGSAVDMRKGYWFNDQILDCHNAEIERFSWNQENGYSIAIQKAGAV